MADAITPIRNVLTQSEFSNYHKRFIKDLENAYSGGELLQMLRAQPWKLTTEEIAQWIAEFQINVHRYLRNADAIESLTKYRFARLIAFLNLVQDATGQDPSTPGWALTRRFLMQQTLIDGEPYTCADLFVIGRADLIYEIVTGRINSEDTLNVFKDA